MNGFNGICPFGSCLKLFGLVNELKNFVSNVIVIKEPTIGFDEAFVN